jgi:hypothetical protein
MSLSDQGDEIVVEVGEGKPGLECTVWLMSIAPQVAVKIEKGENTGQDIIYYNVARRLVLAGSWKGPAVRLTLPKKGILPPDCTACVALLQSGNIGPVRAAAAWGSFSS